jgi:hypothetical protein
MKRIALLSALAFAACSPASQEPTVSALEDPAATQTPAPAATATPNDALTADGWGPLKIGMTLAEVTTALGPDANPDAVGGPDPESCDEFRPERAPEGILVMIQEGKLTRISLVELSPVKTDKGLGIGDTAEAVKLAYGDAAKATPHKYQDKPAEYITAWAGGPRSEPYVEDEAARGIVYEVDGTGKVGAVHAGGPSIQYVEGCA